MTPQFQEDNFKKNLAIVKMVEEVAAQKMQLLRRLL